MHVVLPKYAPVLNSILNNPEREPQVAKRRVYSSFRTAQHRADPNFTDFQFLENARPNQDCPSKALTRPAPLDATVDYTAGLMTSGFANTICAEFVLLEKDNLLQRNRLSESTSDYLNQTGDSK
jgi:hypothetical protein